MSLKKQLAAGSIWTVAGSLLNNLSSFVVFAVLARLLAPTEFGIVAFATIFVEVGRTLVVAGISDALVQRPDWDEAVASTGFWLNLAAGVVVATLLGLAAIGVSAASDNRTFALVMAVLALDLVIEGATAVHVAKLRRDFRFKQLATRGMAGRLFSGALGVGLALAGWGVWALVVSRLVGSVLYSVVTWRASDFRPRRTFSREHARAMMPFAAGQLGVQLLGQLNIQAGGLVLGGILGPAAIAQYRVGTRAISIVISLVISPIQQTSLSAFSRMQRDLNSVSLGYLRMTRVCSIIAFPTLFGLSATAPDFISLTFGNQWKDAGYVLLALALYAGPSVINYFQAPALAAIGRSDLSFRRSVVGTATNLIFAVAAAPFGVIAVAVALTIREHVSLPYNLFLMRRAIGLGVRSTLLNIAPSYLCAATMCGIVTFLRIEVLAGAPLVLRLLACVAAGGVVYAALLALFARRFLRTNWDELRPMLPAGVLRRLPGQVEPAGPHAGSVQKSQGKVASSELGS